MSYTIIKSHNGFSVIHDHEESLGDIRHFESFNQAAAYRDEKNGLKPLELGSTSEFPSEAAKYLSLTMKYLSGNGIDIGSGGWPVVENAIQVELPSDQFNVYTSGRKPKIPIQWHGDMLNLPFKDNTLDFVHASHIIEDFSHEMWAVMFNEWRRVVKPTGFIVILVPEVHLWAQAIANGQPPNCSHHAPEPSLGDVSRVARSVGLHVVEERMTNLFPGDYSILAVLRK